MPLPSPLDQGEEDRTSALGGYESRMRRFCERCKGMRDHTIHRLGKTDWIECKQCSFMSRRYRRKSDWAGV